MHEVCSMPRNVMNVVQSYHLDEYKLRHGEKSREVCFHFGILKYMLVCYIRFDFDVMGKLLSIRFDANQWLLFGFE